MIKLFTVCTGVVLACLGCELFPSSSNHPGIGESKTIITQPGVQAVLNPKQPVNFAPKYKSKLFDKYADAVNIYDSSPKAEQGVYQCDGLVFVIVCIDTNKEEIEYLEGTSMLRAVVLLRENFPALPTKFRTRNRVVEKNLDDNTGIYRYALAYRESDIQKAMNAASDE